MNAIFSLLLIAAPVIAQQGDFPDNFGSVQSDVARDPSALTIQPRKRAYAGGADEEDLRVQASLPDAEIKVDSRTLQRDVYKSVYNQELKEERHDDAEE